MFTWFKYIFKQQFLVELGPDALVAKFNVVAASRNIPIHPGEQFFLGIWWRGLDI